MAGVEELSQRLLAYVAMVHAGVIPRIAVQLLLVVGEEGSGGEALVPDQRHPAAGPKDARKFGAGAGAIKPVEGLPGGNQVHAARLQAGGFGAASPGDELSKAAQEFFPGRTHGGVGLDGKHAVSILQENSGQQAGAGADIGRYPLRGKPAMAAQALQQLRRVGGAVADVVGNAIRETFGGAKFGRRSLVVGHWALGIRTRLQLSGEKRWKRWDVRRTKIA